MPLKDLPDPQMYLIKCKDTLLEAFNLLIEMEVHGVNIDAASQQPVVVLKNEASQRYLPIWIGQNEATSILMELQGIKPYRPMTHDLLKTLLDALEAVVIRVIVNDIIEGTFYAKIFLDVENGEIEIDARPSDAIALAVRVGAPIFVEDSVIAQASIPHGGIINDSEDDVKRFRKFLDNVEADDFRDISSS